MTKEKVNFSMNTGSNYPINLYRVKIFTSTIKRVRSERWDDKTCQLQEIQQGVSKTTDFQNTNIGKIHELTKCNYLYFSLLGDLF